MRCLLLIFALAACGSLSAQTIIDTLYDQNGKLNQIRYSSRMDLSKKSKADLFMRGIKEGDTVLELDSIQLFNGRGDRKTIKEFAPPGEEMKALKAAYQKSAKTTRQDSERTNPSSNNRPSVEGRAGMIVRRPILRSAASKSLEDIKRLDDSPEIELIQNPEIENGEIIAKIHIPAGSTQRKLVLDFGDGQKWEKLYSIRGYHLNESDFRRHDQLTEAQTWYAEGQQFLYLRLRSTEKLMHIYQDGERYTQVPVGRQLDEVRIGALPAGKYLLEIIDLGTREKRYHWIVAGK